MAAYASTFVPVSRERPRAIALWLFAVAMLVFAMVVVGGITRLTESGLSIVKWEPLSGVLPPLSAAGLAGRVCGLPRQPAGRTGQRRDGPRRVQGHLFLGVCPPPACPADRLRLRPAPAVVRGHPRDPQGLRLAPDRDSRPRWAAGRDRLVDGRVRPRQPAIGGARASRDAPRYRADHHGRLHLDRARPD